MGLVGRDNLVKKPVIKSLAFIARIILTVQGTKGDGIIIKPFKLNPLKKTAAII